jgi:hypothetical protein
MRRGITIAAGALAAVVLAVASTAALAGDSDATQERRPHEQAASPPSAVAFLAGVVRRLAANDYAAAWDTLVPVQQRLVPRRAYVSCESLSPIPGRLTALVPLGVRDELVRVPGTTGAPTLSTAVTFRLRISGQGAEPPVVVRLTAHALRVDGRLAWMLPSARLELHRTPGCGAPPTIGNPAGQL